MKTQKELIIMGLNQRFNDLKYYINLNTEAMSVLYLPLEFL